MIELTGKTVKGEKIHIEQQHSVPCSGKKMPPEPSGALAAEL